MRKHHRVSFENRVATGLLQGLINLVTMPFRKKGPRVDLERFRYSWQSVEQLSQGSVEQLKVAVIQADTLIDSVLKAKVSGLTMGDRLKKSVGHFGYNTYQDLWEAHKLRNRIVHEPHHVFTGEEMRQAVGRFRKALRELGIL